MRQHVVRVLHTLDAFAVENPAWPGTPDVNYQEGWIELKQATRWPARGGALKLDHFTKQQRYFLRSRWQNGGNIFLLLKVGREWLLFDGDVAADHVGHCDRVTLLTLCSKFWPTGIQRQEFIKCLSR